MSKIVTKACVIGSGVMGANIAALLASVGMQVTLLDIVPFNGLDEKEKAAGLTEDSLEFRNRLVNGAITKLKKDKQMPLLGKGAINNIRVGNTTDNLDLMEDADWILEVVVERLDIKKNLLKSIAAHAKADAIISSNTSGVSITKIVEDMDDGFKARFMGTHFFNPPRWMGLFEMIPTQWTSKETIETMAHVGGDLLGKTCVYAKDTPNFVGNRIGCFGAAQVMQLTEKYDYDLATVDYITGSVMGHPKSATFGTGDMVGMDIIANVSKNVIDSSKDEKEITEYTMPAYVIELMEKGFLGNKTKQGICDFFTMSENLPEGKKFEDIHVVFVGDSREDTGIMSKETGHMCATLGLHYTVCSPKPYSMSEGEQKKIRDKMAETGGTLVVTDDVDAAIKDADFIVPDVWTYYGYEEEEADRMANFMPKYQLNMDMLNRASKHCKALHCLPANREVEITSEVLDHPTRSIVFQEAENRLHTQRGLLAWYLYPRMREADETLLAYNEGKVRSFLDTRLK